MSTKKKKRRSILWVDICEAKPNPMFTEEQRSWIRFLRYNQHVACADCGKKLRLHWTMLCAFRSHSLSQFSIGKGKPFPPLTPVCSAHCMSLDWQVTP